MQALVINLNTATERMTLMSAQLHALGIAFERLAAVDIVEAQGQGSQSYWSTWQRPLKDTEKACLLSHIKAWRVVAEQDAPHLILEDDAVLSKRLPALFEQLAGGTDMEHLTLEVRGRRKLVSEDSQVLCDGLLARRLYQDQSGAAAYVLWPEGARKLLSHVERRCGLADAVICAAYDLASYQIEPACAVQQDRCAQFGIALPLEPRSSIDAGPAPRARRTLRFRLRRIGAQLRMGFRQLRMSRRAQWREVEIVAQDFAPCSEVQTSSYVVRLRYWREYFQR